MLDPSQLYVAIVCVSDQIPTGWGHLIGKEYGSPHETSREWLGSANSKARSFIKAIYDINPNASHDARGE